MFLPRPPPIPPPPVHHHPLTPPHTPLPHISTPAPRQKIHLKNTPDIIVKEAFITTQLMQLEHSLPHIYYSINMDTFLGRIMMSRAGASQSSWVTTEQGARGVYRQRSASCFNLLVVGVLFPKRCRRRGENDGVREQDGGGRGVCSPSLLLWW